MSKSLKTKSLTKQRIEERTKKEVELRRQGYAYAKIAEIMGEDVRTVFNDIKRVMDQIIAETREDVEYIRQQEIDRIDSVMPAVMAQAETGDKGAIESMVKLMDRRSKYLGLDAAQKQDTSGIVTVYLRESQKEEL